MISEATSIGECMIELSRGDDGRFGLAYGGDTFNTAVYLARAGIATTYVTALGDDTHSDAIVALAQSEGIGTDAIVRAPSRAPGLYMVETDSKGERRFQYWREMAPARELFGTLAADHVGDAIRQAGLIYFSGITLWLYDGRGLERFFAILAAARSTGARIAFDSNFRARLWGSDTSRARSIFAQALALTDVALPTFDDEQALWDDASPDATLERLTVAGVKEIAVKLGRDGALVAHHGKITPVPTGPHGSVIDTTGAGDSFNAAYLASRLRGRTSDEAAAVGNSLAGVVIRHRGAVVPRAATTQVLATL